MTAARLQRYAVFLSGHSYDIIYKSTHKHCNADALSRLPLDSMDTEETDEVDMFYNAQLEMLPVTSEQMSSLTRKDRILAQVLDFVSTGRFPNILTMT